MLLVINMEKCCKKEKPRTKEDKKRIIRRLKIVEGQIRGIIKMIEEDRYCDDVLTQISASNKSLKSIGNELLNIHLKTCVVDNIKEDKLEIVDDVMEIIRRFN